MQIQEIQIMMRISVAEKKTSKVKRKEKNMNIHETFVSILEKDKW